MADEDLAEYKLGEIIGLEEGYDRVYKDGVEPFLNLVESGERDFFKAKDFVKLYHLIFKMCIQREPNGWGEDMYAKYDGCIRDHLETHATPALQKAQKEYETAFLRVWAKRWQNQTLIVKGLSKLFMYVDRSYATEASDVLTVKEQGFRIYKDVVFDKFAPTAAEYVVSAVKRERDGEEQDTMLLRHAVAVFVEMGREHENSQLKIYQTDLEQRLVKHAVDYYARVSRAWLDGDSCPNYMEKAEQCLESERGRVESYMDQSTMKPLLDACYAALLGEHQMELVTKDTGIEHMLRFNRADDLSRMYRLYHHKEDDLKPLASLFEEHVRAVGTAVVAESTTITTHRQQQQKRHIKDVDGGTAVVEAKRRKVVGKGGDDAASKNEEGEVGHTLVRKLVDLHDRYARIVRSSFQSSQIFQKALKHAFEAFINRDSRVSRMLAKYVNEVLKKHSKVKATINDVESTLENVVFLYGYVTEKDVFERDYQNHLAHRLLNGLCESEHAEKSMIAKLKSECGYQWTNKLEGMFKDVTLSKSSMLEFRNFYDTEAENGLTLQVNVCTTAYWPVGKYAPVQVPRELETPCEKYRQFYLNKHNGHKLEWRMDRGTAEVQVQFNGRVKRSLVCSTYQMLVLLAFNSNPGKPITFKRIMDVTGITQDAIAPHLLSLVHPNVKVLLKKPNVKQLEPTDMLMVNPKFHSKMLKVQIPLFYHVQTKKERSEEDAAIELQRQHQVDASIVRVMKTRKELKHAELVGEVIQQLKARFPPKPSLIKRRIEALIEGEYLERDANDRSVYNYLA